MLTLVLYSLLNCRTACSAANGVVRQSLLVLLTQRPVALQHQWHISFMSSGPTRHASAGQCVAGSAACFTYLGLGALQFLLGIAASFKWWIQASCNVLVNA